MASEILIAVLGSVLLSMHHVNGLTCAQNVTIDPFNAVCFGSQIAKQQPSSHCTL
jgi:hypothetical protein